MRGPHNIWRLIRTGATFERTGALKVILDATDAPRSMKIALRSLVWPFQWLGIKGDQSRPPVTRAITALGPAYIKFGQILSTRPDVVGQELSDQLQVLQDKLPPFSREQAIEMIEADLGRNIDDVFSEFSEPVAAASIAQVHKAVKRETGEAVAVKVLRPGIERAFRKDVDAFYLAAWFIQRFLPSSRRLRPQDVVAHFEGVVLGELDLRLESSSAAEFHANTINDAGFYVPKVDWALSSRRVMTLEWLEGITASNLSEISAAGHDRKKLGSVVLQMFLSHALRDGFFHADMHQGNLKIMPNGDVAALDFGIMGVLDVYTRRVYAEIIFGFIRKDYQRIAEVHFEAGYVPANQDVDQFARALRAVGEPIFGMDATQISMGRVMSYLLEVTERFGMATRTELILLQRTMVVVEGVARSLDPKINIWEVSQPVVESYIKESIGPKALARDLGRTAIVLSRFGPKLPALAESILMAQSQGAEPAQQMSSARQAMFLVFGGGVCAAIGAIVAIVVS
ncbi:2-octaprenylphenol hydroxylase [Pacificibacter maritimus]|uniref:2-octaprenylphenol hydroxylase n=1 Tax=Pacificibacter maritimus TaxID=762213 RepID=A0A3N4UVB4_9RHOB|nr:2-polyprenylphenol 6-hydroxylase [Pacificibacter maritimus]RPE64644.1 2-octaprenylphenol hydroxylase [Pacificibacter maritimus]